MDLGCTWASRSPLCIACSFSFDEGYLQLKGPIPARLPYPVPFKLLGKEAEGYLDTLYLSERLRISVGNKGTTFILSRENA